MYKPKAFLVTTARNEAPYFLEWVAHHLEVGFTDIVIFQNDSDDLTHETLSALRSIGAIQYYYGRGDAGLHKPHAYARAAKLKNYAQSDWAMALDMDEFLLVKTGDGTLTDLFAALPESDCIHLNARQFGNSGYEILTDQLVTDRFCMADHPLGAPDHAAPYKSLFRPAMFQRPGIHAPEGPTTTQTLQFCNGSGLKPEGYARIDDTSTDPEGSKFAQINHYATRDLASFMLKSMDQPEQPLNGKAWSLRNTNFAIDDSTRPFLARVKARMAALNDATDGHLMELRAQAIFTHLARYYTALQKPQMRALRQLCKSTPNAKDPHKRQPG
jgi:hypothetical protein